VFGLSDKIFAKMQGEEFDSKLRKMSFYGKEGNCLGHAISTDGIKVDKAKIDLIANLPPSTCVKDIRPFLGHARFYR